VPRWPTTICRANRFRHGTTFPALRPDKQPADCRYDQLEETAAFELEQIFGA
jgi:ATP-dependent DNA ligase